MKYKIYRYTFPDGKFYIGMTSLSIEERRDCGYSHNPALKKALKVGWRKIKAEILDTADTREKAFKLEEYYIDLFDATNKGYNISKGGQSTYKGLKHTEEYKKKMSDLCKGKKFSDETLRKLKDAHAWQRRAVISLDYEGNIIKRYKSLSDAAEDVGGHKTNISRACAGHKSYKGFMWQLDEKR